MFKKKKKIKYTCVFSPPTPYAVAVSLQATYRDEDEEAKGFQNLKVLGLDMFDSLEAITVEDGAMPKVEKLIIQRCELLKKEHK
jgi:hypothetical protein